MSDMRTELDRALRRAANPLAPEGPHCPTCGTYLRDRDTVRECPMECKR